MAPPAPSSSELLRSSLRDPRSRELAITRFLVWAFAGCTLTALALMPLIGWTLSLLLAALLSFLGFIYFLEMKALERGMFHPLLQWANVTVEVSAPALLFLADLRTRGAEYALTTPPLAFWGALIMLSGLRASKRISLYAGVLAATEYALLYALLAHPRLPADALVTLQPPLIAVRCALLLASGLLTAFVTSQFIKHAEAAFSSVREKELAGKYLLHERIGAGGMAEVYRATYSPEGGFEKLVAVKRVLPSYSEDNSFLQMFKREAEVCSRLSHPNIVQVFDLGRDRGTYFLAMEYIDGISLATLIRLLGPERLPVPAVAWIGAEVASALDYLHRKTGENGEKLHLVHRDVNPPNVLISMSGEVKLSDFGIARAAQAVTLTEVGVVRGKAGYMPPEQIYGEKLDGRADLFGLGISLYEALIGRKCFTGSDTQAVLNDSVQKTLPPPSQLRPDIPPAMDEIIMALIDKDVSRRTSSGAMLRSQLLAFADGQAALQGQLLLSAAMKLAQQRDALMRGGIKPDPSEAPTMASKSQPGSHQRAG